MHANKFPLLVIGLTVLLIALLARPVGSFWGEGGKTSFVLGASFSAVLISLAYATNRLAFTRQRQAFLKIVLGGMLIRFVLIVVALFVVWKFTEVHLIAFVSALMGFYLLLQGIEIWFVQKQFMKHTKPTT